jgi:hypothetical protein
MPAALVGVLLPETLSFRCPVVTWIHYAFVFWFLFPQPIMLIVPLLIYHLELPGKITSHGNSSGTFSTEKSPSCFSELARLDRKITVKLQ